MSKNKGNKINKRISPTTTPVDLKYYRQINNDNTILNIKKEIPSKKSYYNANRRYQTIDEISARSSEKGSEKSENCYA